MAVCVCLASAAVPQEGMDLSCFLLPLHTNLSWGCINVCHDILTPDLSRPVLPLLCGWRWLQTDGELVTASSLVEAALARSQPRAEMHGPCTLEAPSLCGTS